MAGLRHAGISVEGIFVQSPNYDSLFRMMKFRDQLGALQWASQDLEKFVNTAGPIPLLTTSGPFFYADGIAVGRPEENAIKLARSYFDEAYVVDEALAFSHIAPLIAKDLVEYYTAHPHEGEFKGVGGTTAISFLSLFAAIKVLDQSVLNKVDNVIVIGTEGNIDPALKRIQLERVSVAMDLAKECLGASFLQLKKDAPKK